jgi:glycosyltransferase involved in cell wall biosynthesis
VATGEPHPDGVSTRGLNVLVVITSANRRGAEIEGVQLTSRLAAAGCSARVVALAGGDGNSLPVEALGPSPTSPTTLRALRRAARGVDVVIGYGSSTLPACALALGGTRTPFIYRSIGDPGAWVRGAMHRRRTALLFGRAAHVVALSETSSDTVAALYGVPPERRDVTPNARGADEFRPPSDDERAAARERWSVPPKSPLAVAVGALSAEKRTWLAVEAAARVDGLTLLIAGDGPERERVAAAAAMVPGDRVRLLGQIDDLVSLLHAADVLVLTSSTEGMPGVVIEAGLCGVPVVATDVGMLGELVVDGASGVIVPTADPPVVAEAIERVLSDRDTFGGRALEHTSEHFVWEVVLPTWLDVLERVAGRRGRRP